jgi:hypothetical protein
MLVPESSLSLGVAAAERGVSRKEAELEWMFRA